MLKIIENSKIWFSLSGIIIAIGIVMLFVQGLNLGIDFEGGTIITIGFENTDFEEKDITDILHKYASNGTINTVDKSNIEIRSNQLTNETSGELIAEILDKYSLKEEAVLSTSEISPSIGKETAVNAFISLILASIGMLLYVAIRFEFKFGIASIVALLHDVLITLSVYTIFQVVVNASFIAAVLTILGYSINDTIVIFDRLRENKKKIRSATNSEIANRSVNETLRRSLFTVITTLIAISSVYVFVPTVREFTFPLIVGIIAGAYSSIFIAAPTWTILSDKFKSKSKKGINSPSKNK